jgi:hypothetical protein
VVPLELELPELELLVLPLLELELEVLEPELGLLDFAPLELLELELVLELVLELLDLPLLELVLEVEPLLDPLAEPELELLELDDALLIATDADVGVPNVASPLTDVSVTKKSLPLPMPLTRDTVIVLGAVSPSAQTSEPLVGV